MTRLNGSAQSDEMNPSTLHNLARKLLASELASAEISVSEQALRACEKLRPPVSRLAGSAGFASLLSRALTLAKRQSPVLHRLEVGARGSLEGTAEIQQLDSPDAVREGGVILLAEMLGLLVSLIGEPLTLSLVHEAWAEESTRSAMPEREEKQ